MSRAARRELEQELDAAARAANAGLPSENRRKHGIVSSPAVGSDKGERAGQPRPVGRPPSRELSGAHATQDGSVRTLAAVVARSLMLSGSPPHGKLLIPFERRDGRVVEGARLEIALTVSDGVLQISITVAKPTT